MAERYSDKPFSESSTPGHGQFYSETSNQVKSGSQTQHNENKNNFSIYHLNVQCIRNKVSDLEVVFKDNSLDCICINEHWLSMDELELCRIAGYKIISGFCRTSMIHGGVCILAKTTMDCEKINLDDCSIEQHGEIAGVYFNKIKLQVITAYRSPHGDFNIFLQILNRVLTLVDTTKPVVLTGDFNVNFQKRDQTCNELEYFFLSFGFHICTGFKTRNNASLDNIFTNINLDNLSSKVIDMSYLSDHNAILLEYKVN